MGSINYSIIIPHKNIPELLRRCLDSIPKREDVQIIIVDDNSSPDLVDFDCFPGMGEPGIEVYLTKEGGGAGYARNVGLKHAKGKWLLFADADDYYVKDFSKYLDNYLDSESDVVFFDIESRDVYSLEPTKEAQKISSLLHSFDYSSKSNLIELVFNNEVPWGKMMKRSLIEKNNISFDEVLASNDTMFVLKSLYSSISISFCNEVLYCWSTRQGSLVHSLNRDVIFSRYEVDLRRNRFCLDKGHKEYTRSIAFWLYQISKLGMGDFFYALRLCRKYKINPFTKCKNWIKHLG